jgi:hypothetical protein
MLVSFPGNCRQTMGLLAYEHQLNCGPKGSPAEALAIRAGQEYEFEDPEKR